MGLMQLMPSTWREQQQRLALGPDPFDVSDNLAAGADYLRQMVARFGLSGGLAAYNAGPARYLQYLAGRSLPQETRTYVARLAPQLLRGDGAKIQSKRKAAPWAHSPLNPTPEGGSNP
jgi:soluble lytic murein transglycosylase-like protein